MWLWQIVQQIGVPSHCRKEAEKKQAGLGQKTKEQQADSFWDGIESDEEGTPNDEVDGAEMERDDKNPALKPTKAADLIDLTEEGDEEHEIKKEQTVNVVRKVPKTIRRMEENGELEPVKKPRNISSKVCLRTIITFRVFVNEYQVSSHELFEAITMQQQQQLRIGKQLQQLQKLM
jgi:hypothetical protein